MVGLHRSIVVPALAVLLAAGTEECEASDETRLSLRDCRKPEVQSPHPTTDQETGDRVIHVKIRLRCPKPGVDVAAQVEIQKHDRDLFSGDDWETTRSGEVEFTAGGNGGQWQVRYFPDRDAKRDDKIDCEDRTYRVVVDFPDGNEGDDVLRPPPKEIVCG